MGEILSATLLSLSIIASAFGQTNSTLSPELFKHWTHSREEDAAGLMVFRPADYPFPRARGRTGFEIKADGEFIEYQIGPDDRSLRVFGRWKAEDNTRILVRFNDSQAKPYTLEIVSLKDGLLKIRSNR